MANQESGDFTTWLARRLRVAFDRAQGRDSGRDPRPRRRGLVVALCILASVLLWFTFAMRETYTRILEFPTEVRNLPPDEALADLPPAIVRAQVEGEGIQLIRLFYDPPVIPIDAASESVDLAVLAPDVVKNVRLDAIMPRTVVVYREPRIQRFLPVRAVMRVLTPEGHHMVGPPVLEPDSVWVSGAGTVVRDLRWWPTSAAPVSTGKDTLLAEVALSDSLRGLVLLSDESVTVRGTVREFTEGTRSIEVFVLDAPTGRRITLEPARVRITFQVPLGDYDRAMTADMWGIVPHDAIVADTVGAVVPDVRMPEGIPFRQVRIDPPSVRYFEVLD